LDPSHPVVLPGNTVDGAAVAVEAEVSAVAAVARRRSTHPSAIGLCKLLICRVMEP